MRVQTIRRICARPDKASSGAKRLSLTSAERAEVRAKTAGTCHVCGGRVGRRWQADHVVPHRSGGKHALENYLPICGECNRLRWFHAPEVIRLIMRLGVYAKNEIRNETKLGDALVSLLRKRLRDNRKRRNVRPAK